jgi:hypothetical protein
MTLLVESMDWPTTVAVAPQGMRRPRRKVARIYDDPLMMVVAAYRVTSDLTRALSWIDNGKPTN